MIYVFLIVMSAIIGGVGGLGLMTTMSLNVFERRREMGVMRALGATPRIVWLMIVAEGIVIGLLSWTIAALLAWPVSKVARRFHRQSDVQKRPRLHFRTARTLDLDRCFN